MAEQGFIVGKSALFLLVAARQEPPKLFCTLLPEFSHFFQLALRRCDDIFHCVEVLQKLPCERGADMGQCLDDGALFLPLREAFALCVYGQGLLLCELLMRCESIDHFCCC